MELVIQASLPVAKICEDFVKHHCGVLGYWSQFIPPWHTKRNIIPSWVPADSDWTTSLPFLTLLTGYRCS